MELLQNGHYEFEVIAICSNTNGYDYLLVLGPDDNTYKVYNIIKCQYTSVPNTIYGIVKDVINGKARIKQDECRVLQEHYELEHFYFFKISDRKIDNNGKFYYVLEDDFSYQRWYSDDEYEIGDELILCAKSISSSGYIRYEKHKPLDTNALFSQNIAPPQKTYAINGPIFDGEDESEKVEYKTSIVFTPKQEADIDKQIFNIIREIAAFMNTNGGTLYIGIHDKTKQVLGIEKDLPHLCEGVSQNANSYTADYDHYQLKIRDSLIEMCSTVAGSHINISFPEQEGVKYCKIDVTAAKSPIWTKGNMLFQRQGNQTQMLRGESLTQFVGERIGSYILAMAKEKTAQSDNMENLIRTAVKNAINDRRIEVAAPVVTKTIEARFWIVWYDNGTWARLKTKSDEPNVFKQIPVSEESTDMVVVFCHKSGTVNIVNFSDFNKKTKQGQINKNGYNPNETPLEIFICHPTYLLAVHSADQGGTEYIKLHHLTDFSRTASGRNQGSYIIPKSKGHVLEFKLISIEQAISLKAIIFSKRDTTQSFGLDWNNVQIQSEISLLSSL